MLVLCTSFVSPNIAMVCNDCYLFSHCEGGGSVAQHLLTSYSRSLLAVLIAQFTKKRMRGGMAGVVELARTCVPVKARSRTKILGFRVLGLGTLYLC